MLRSRTTIYVTHDQDEALSLADRIVVLSEGRTLQIGSPEELYPGRRTSRLHALWATATFSSLVSSKLKNAALYWLDQGSNSRALPKSG